jgi:hypothetical protein
MTVRYRTFSVVFEHAIEGSDQRRINRAVVTVYGESDFAIQAALARQFPEYREIVVMEVEGR